MNKLVIAALGLFFISCTANSSQQKGTSAAGTAVANMVEGKDYVILRRFRLQDNQGFAQPMEASSFVLLANWTVDGNVQWNGMNKCIPEIVQASLRAASPDGAYELMVLPVTQFDWSNDPVYLDAMQRGFNMHSCTISEPLDAAGYIRESFAPYLQAEVKSAGTIDALQAMMDAGAAQMTALARSAGTDAYHHNGSAAEATLQFNDGRDGLAFCTLMQTITTMPGTQGQVANNFQCYVSMRTVIKYPKGNEETARKIMSTFFSSARINPSWINAIQKMYTAIGKNAQDETWKQVQITQQAQQEISNNIVRSWESKQANDPVSRAYSTEDFGRYLRGVENYKDDNGNTVELTSGYGNAWSKGDGSYLLSNNPAFDPNVTFNEDWKRLSK